jgi:hypothetical protein
MQHHFNTGDRAFTDQLFKKDGDFDTPVIIIKLEGDSAQVKLSELDDYPVFPWVSIDSLKPAVFDSVTHQYIPGEHTSEGFVIRGN